MMNYNYRQDQITEWINSSSRMMETLLQGSTTATSIGSSNNNGDSGINETHDYHDEGDGVDIADEDRTKEIWSIIDRINW